MIISKDKHLYDTLILECGYMMQDFYFRITTFLIQSLKYFDETTNESVELFNYVSCILHKIRKSVLLQDLTINSTLIKIFCAVSCKNIFVKRLFKLFFLYSAEDDIDIRIHNLKLHKIELSCIYAENKKLNVSVTKLLKHEFLLIFLKYNFRLLIS